MSFLGFSKKKKTDTGTNPEPEEEEDDMTLDDVDVGSSDDTDDDTPRITPLMMKKMLNKQIQPVHGDSNVEETKTDDKGIDMNEVLKEEAKEEAKEVKEEEEAQQILKREAEKKAQEYAEKSLKQMINGEELLTNMQTFMQSVRDLPEKIYDENFEHYAIVLSNTTINGEKIFNDVEEARQFINKIRNGAKTSKRYIKPRAYKQFKQEIQKQLQLTPMISRNVKRRTNAINVYQY